MNRDVESHELPELSVCEAKLVGEVRSVIQSTVARGNLPVITVLVGVNNGCDAGNFRAEVETVLECRLPVFRLVNTALVGFHEVRAWLAGKDTHRELSHRMHVGREGADHRLFLLR